MNFTEDKQIKSEKENTKYNGEQYATIFVCVITSFITTFMGSALNLSIPAMGDEFGVSATAIGWLVTGYTLIVAALSVPFGRIADLTNRKIILVIGIAFFSVCSLASAFASSMQMALFLRISQGIGASMIFSTNTAILLTHFPGSQRGKVLGYSIASTYVGLSLGPVLGGVLNHHFGWGSIYLLTFLISIIVLGLAIKKLPKEISEGHPNNAGDSKWDIVGNVLYVGMIVTLMFGLSTFSTIGFAKYFIILGLMLGAIFVIHELKIKNPIIQVRMFYKNAAYTLSNLAALLNYGATFANSYLISIYLQVVKGYDSQVAGIVLITSPIIMAFLSPVFGRLSDRFSPFKLASIGMGLCAIGLLIFTFMKEDSSLGYIVFGLAIAGMGFAIFSSPNTNAVMSCVEKKDYSVASSILATMRSLGHTLSMVVVTIVVGMYMGKMSLAEAEPEMIIQAMHLLFIIFTGTCVVGTFISLKRK